MAFGNNKITNKKRRAFSYRGMRVNFFGIPVGGEIYKPNPKTNKPKERLVSTRGAYLRSFPYALPEGSPKNLLLIYDIPHTRKKDRDWFRRQLKGFGFMMIQKSVWVGPAPLPPMFTEYVKSIGLESNFKTFKLAKPYSLSIKVKPNTQ